MTTRDARRGAALAGAALLALPVLDVAMAAGSAAATHFVVGVLGAGLIALAVRW